MIVAQSTARIQPPKQSAAGWPFTQSSCGMASQLIGKPHSSVILQHACSHGPPPEQAPPEPPPPAMPVPLWVVVVVLPPELVVVVVAAPPPTTSVLLQASATHRASTAEAPRASTRCRIASSV